MCKEFGTVEEIKVYFHPQTQKHMGVGKVVFHLAKSAKLCVEKLNNTSKMGNIMKVELDSFGRKRHPLLLYLDSKFTQNAQSRLHRDNLLNALSKPVEKTEDPLKHSIPSDYDSLPQRFPNLGNSSGSCRRDSPLTYSSGSFNSSYRPSVNDHRSVPPSESINGITIPPEDPLDVRIRKLLHLSSTPSLSPAPSDSKPKPQTRLRSPLLTSSSSVKPKLTPLLQSPSLSTPTPSTTHKMISNSHRQNSKSPKVNSSSRRTLLPLPFDEDFKPKKKVPPQTNPVQPMKQPLLVQPVNYSHVTQLAAETSLQFVSELRGIIRKDLERRLIEGCAFRTFEEWWEAQKRVCEFSFLLTS